MKSTGKGKNAKRTPVDQARMTLTHQLITAKLNCAAFDCTTAVDTMIADADAAYSSTDINWMITAAGALDLYNNSGDTIIVSPPLPVPGKATPKDSLLAAVLSLWDVFWDLLLP